MDDRELMKTVYSRPCADELDALQILSRISERAEVKSRAPVYAAAAAAAAAIGIGTAVIVSNMSVPKDDSSSQPPRDMAAVVAAESTADESTADESTPEESSVIDSVDTSSIPETDSVSSSPESIPEASEPVSSEDSSETEEYGEVIISEPLQAEMDAHADDPDRQYPVRVTRSDPWQNLTYWFFPYSMIKEGACLATAEQLRSLTGIEGADVTVKLASETGSVWDAFLNTYYRAEIKVDEDCINAMGEGDIRVEINLNTHDEKEKALAEINALEDTVPYDELRTRKLDAMKEIHDRALSELIAETGLDRAKIVIDSGFTSSVYIDADRELLRKIYNSKVVGNIMLLAEIRGSDF
ncbi:MAG: hypothetical protein IKN17_02485 [Ruminococcus sp.]|nr:hypothetical protein [Ruminococcus sp.]